MTIDKIPIWLDCDPGHDDAFALLMASQLPYFDLLGISTVYGNASLAHTTTNALALLDAFKLAAPGGVDVYPGASRPLKREAHHAPDIHGESGLDGTDLLPKTPSKHAKEAGSAVAAMKRAVDAHAGQIAIVATGTLTNVAQLVQQHPDVVPRIRFLSIMGGGVEQFNWGTDAEFNIWCDPHAARAVLAHAELAAKTFLVPLDVTHKAIATPAVVDRVRGGGGDAGQGGSTSTARQMLYELLLFFGDTYRHKFGFEAGPPVHDPCAVAVLLPEYFPELRAELNVEAPRYDVDVVTDGPQMGRTVLARPDEQNGVRVVLDMNVERFWDLILESLEILDARP